VPVVYGSEGSVVLILKDTGLLKKNWSFVAYHPGSSQPVKLKANKKGGGIELYVPLVRNTAMVTLMEQNK
jgi:hypothetical protein